MAKSLSAPPENDEDSDTIDYRAEQCRARSSLLNYYFPSTDGYIKASLSIKKIDYEHEVKIAKK